MSRMSECRVVGRRRTFLALSLSVLLGLGVPSGVARAQADDAAASQGARLVREGGYPELHVDGAPFFLHAARFFYFRVPRDLWESALEGHRRLGINTIDLVIPWNWHEPQEGELDFGGRRNPRRDLRGLLQLITEKGFKLIARPGPLIGADWRHSGYPDWLLARPEYAMSPQARQQGRAPPPAELAARDPEAAARAWLRIPGHLDQARRWLTAVAKELAPYAASHSLTVRVVTEKGEETKRVPGPLVLVQVGDLPPAATAPVGPAHARYVAALRAALAQGGLDTLWVVPAQPAGEQVGGVDGAIGEWRPTGPPASSAELLLGARDAAELEYAVERLKAQPGFPPLLAGYESSWPAPADDARPPVSPAANTLLSSRLAIGRGARGLNYVPAQDTLTPAGYEIPAAHRHYRWDAALDVNGNERPRSRAVLRNAHVLPLWGHRLAASHLRADFGVVVPAAPGERRIPMQIGRVGYLAGLAAELLDPERQPVEQLLRHALVVLPALRERLSEAAQSALVEYVRRGGVLAVVGRSPGNEAWGALGEREPAAGARRSRRFGEGRVLEAEDFYSWVELEESFRETRMRGEEPAAVRALQELLSAAGGRPAVRRGVEGPGTGELAVTQLVSDAGTGPLGARTGGEGLLSVTNLSFDETGEETLNVLSPRAGLRGAEEDYLLLGVQVPPRESLLLPLHYPLCAAAKPEARCRDEVVAAGAELLRVERDGQAIELTWYAPARAQVILRLARPPNRVRLEELRPEAEWVPGRNELRVSVPRGAWPSFERVLRIQLPYTPFLPEPRKEKRRGRSDFDAGVADAVRLPLGDDASLGTHPPLVTLAADGTGQMLVEGTNHDVLGRDLDFRVEGPVRGSAEMGLGTGETRQVVMNLKPGARTARAGNDEGSGEDGLLWAEVEVRSGRERRRSPIALVPLRKEGTTPYQYDFDRDGAAEWVVENAALRLIVSPEEEGRALALVDKESQANLLTSVGGMLEQPGDAPLGTHRRYTAAWRKEGTDTGLELREAESSAPIEKVVRLDGADGATVHYTVPAKAAWPVAILTSVPAERGEPGTRFCWTESGAAPERCDALPPGAEALHVPEAVRRVEVRTPGRAGLAIAWDAGRMRIERKRFSALLRVELPGSEDGAAVRLTLRYQVLRGR